MTSLSHPQLPDPVITEAPPLSRRSGGPLWQRGLLNAAGRRGVRSLAVGLLVGIVGGALGLMLALLGPVVTLALLVGVLAALYIITDLNAALYGSVATLILLPFGTFPVKIGLTPTLLDLALGAFVVVYLMTWMRGQRRRLRLVPAHAFVLLYAMWLLFGFFMGLRYGNPTATILRQFAETLLAIGLVFVLSDVIGDTARLKRIGQLVMLLVAAQATIALGLWLLPDGTAESLLTRLSRIGYPDGDVIRYIESNVALGERAIGTWVDPNALGGLLSAGCTLLAVQALSHHTVFSQRWLTLGLFGIAAVALLLTSSRASFLAFAVSLGLMILLRYRRYLWLMLAGALGFVLLPQTQEYIDRILQALRGEDLATQMRIGEWTDSLNLIRQYPVFGIGFTGTPTAGGLHRCGQYVPDNG